MISEGKEQKTAVVTTQVFSGVFRGEGTETLTMDKNLAGPVIWPPYSLLYCQICIYVIQPGTHGLVSQSRTMLHLSGKPLLGLGYSFTPLNGKVGVGQRHSYYQEAWRKVFYRCEKDLSVLCSCSQSANWFFRKCETQSDLKDNWG